MNIAEIKNMSIAERIQAMEILWDSFLYEDVAITSPAWHQDVLVERQRKINDHTAKFLTLEELKAIHNQ